jgi:hypothetical protein
MDLPRSPSKLNYRMLQVRSRVLPRKHSATSSPDGDAKADQSTAPANVGAPAGQQQPKRILGIMPNFRAVSAGAHPPPPTAKQSFMIATRNSFDYSSFRAIVNGISYHATNNFASTKSKLHRNLVMSSEANYAFQTTAREKSTEPFPGGSV